MASFSDLPSVSLKSESMINNSAAAAEEEEHTIWKMILHGTNMNSEEMSLCNKSLIDAHFKPYSRRKVARYLKSKLDGQFEPYNYRYSVLISSTSRNTMGKALHGVWMSISLNGVHYFITATYKIVNPELKLTEPQMSKIEYWAYLQQLAAHNMTGYRKYNRISQKLKQELDREYGNGNVWSVVIVKNRLAVKAKALEDKTYKWEMSQLNDGHMIVWRGGQDISDVAARRARVLNHLDTSFVDDYDEESEYNELLNQGSNHNNNNQNGNHQRHGRSSDRHHHSSNRFHLPRSS